MIGHRVKVIRIHGPMIVGNMTGSNASGVVVWRETGLPDQDCAVFIPYTNIVEIVDCGRTP